MAWRARRGRSDLAPYLCSLRIGSFLLLRGYVVSEWKRARSMTKPDANQAEVIKALKACAVSVEIIGKPVDLLVCHKGETALMEVKNPDGGRLTKDQVEFIARWPGKLHIVKSPQEALEAVLGKEVMA